MPVSEEFSDYILTVAAYHVQDILELLLQHFYPDNTPL